MQWRLWSWVVVVGGSVALAALLAGRLEAQLVCAGDRSRTIFAGGPDTGACRQFDGDEARCIRAFHLGNHGIASCYYDGGVCRGCGAHNEAEGDCTNTCAVDVCEGDPSRTVFAGIADSGGCHQFDEDPATCERAFIRGGDGIASCFYTEGEGCRGCGPPNASAGLCVNECAPPPTCAGDPMRTYIGVNACGELDDDLATCAIAFERADFNVDASCFPRVECRPCGFDTGPAPVAITSGIADPIVCTNECVPPPPCLDANRTVFAGGPDTEACGRFNGDPSGCAQAYHLGGAGVASCWYDDNSGRCRGCGPSNESEGRCTNTCVPPPSCPLDPSRMIFAGGPGTEPCRQFDEDQASCEKAFVISGAGYVASCWYDDEEEQCLGCGPRNENALACVNTCAPPPSCPANPSRTDFVGDDDGCEQYSGSQTECERAFYREELLPDGSFLMSSCFYDTQTDECLGCTVGAESNGYCTNECTPIPTCPDPMRTLFAGRLESEGCHNFDGDQSSCEKAYVEGRAGVASCWYDPSEDECRGCGPSNANAGQCTNTCAPPPFCETNPARTTFGACERFNGDAATCGQAFQLDPFGTPVSCTAVPRCRGCDLDDQSEGICQNACLASAAEPVTAPTLGGLGLAGALTLLAGLGGYGIWRRRR